MKVPELTTRKSRCRESPGTVIHESVGSVGVRAKPFRCQLMNFELISESSPSRRKGKVFSTSLFKARSTPAWPRPSTARDSVQAVWMSVTFKVRANSPAPEFPDERLNSTLFHLLVPGIAFFVH